VWQSVAYENSNAYQRSENEQAISIASVSAAAKLYRIAAGATKWQQHLATICNIMAYKHRSNQRNSSINVKKRKKKSMKISRHENGVCRNGCKQ